MNDPVDLLHLTPVGRDLVSGARDADSPLRGLNMVAVFGGHLDAGNLSEQIRNVLLERLESETLASFDIDRLVDYRSRRPHITFDGERFTDYQAPELKLHLVKDQDDEPFLLLSGQEPDYQWERFVKTVMALVEQLDVSTVALVDAIPLPVPHTRPMGVTTHGNKDDLLAGLSTWSPQAKMLAGVSQLLEVRLHEAHRKVTGYTLHVPHYLADATYPQAAVAALEYLGASLNLMLPTEELREAARSVDAQITEEISRSLEIQSMVQGLEKQYDDYREEHGPVRSLLAASEDDIPDADEIGAAVEDFLSENTEVHENPASADIEESALPTRSQSWVQPRFDIPNSDSNSERSADSSDEQNPEDNND